MKYLAVFIVLLIPWRGVSPQGFTSLGNLASYSQSGRVVTLQTADSAVVRFIFYKPDIVRVDFLPTPSSVPDSSFAVVADTTGAVSCSVAETDSTVDIGTSSLLIVCTISPFRVSYFDRSHHLLLSEPPVGGLGARGLERTMRFSIQPSDHFYGTGERDLSLDLRGKSFGLLNTQWYAYSSSIPTRNINIPFIASTNGYALFIDNTYEGYLDLGQADPSVASYTALGGEISFYVIAAPTVGEQLRRYLWLTGSHPLPPRWALGYIQSKYGYRSESDARQTVQTFRSLGIPCDAIVLDLYWFLNMGDLSWNRTLWTDPFKMMSDFLSVGMRTIVITEPYIVSLSSNFQDAYANGYFAKNPQGQPYLLPNWWSCGCNAALFDMTNPSAQSWWWAKHPAFFGSQLAGIWTDLGEPENDRTDMSFATGSRAKIHNVYDLLWAKTVFDGFERMRPGERLVNLTRSGFAGIQRYGVTTWSGDVAKTFGGLALQPTMLLQTGLSGLAYHNSDIGGFTAGTTTEELYSRWMEYGAFNPMMRAHGTDYQPTEPWGFSPTTRDIAVSFIKLRYRLLPYNYSLAFQNYLTGAPLARPLFWLDPTDPNLINDNSSFMWGDAFLVSPVVQQGQWTKTVNLPKGEWVDYWSDRAYQGGQAATVDASLDKIPLFVKSGSVIPMQPVMNYSDEFPLDTLFLVVYPAQTQSVPCALYDDDGKSLDYQAGQYGTMSIQHGLLLKGGSPPRETPSTSYRIDIGRMQGTYRGRPAKRTYVFETHRMTRPGSVELNGRSLAQWLSYDTLRSAVAGYYFDAERQVLYAQFTGSLDSAYVLEAVGSTITTVSPVASPAYSFRLRQNYPNPFNPSTEIGYQLPGAGYATLKVFDLLGREVAVLVSREFQPGTYSSSWNASGFPSGVYFCRLTFGSFVETRRMLLLK